MTKKWSAEVTENSDALDLKEDIFKSTDPAKIAASLKHSAEQSKRRNERNHLQQPGSQHRHVVCNDL